MNSKKANLSYLMLVLVHFLVIGLLTVYYEMNPAAGEINIITNLILSESIVALPILAVAILTKRGEPLNNILGFHRMKVSSALMVVLFTFLVMPLATLFNAISMLWVDNAVAGISGDIVDVPFLLIFLVMAVFGPFCEELAFRGVIFHGYRKSGNIFGAILMSSILFGLMHMNFNQAGYAIVLGIMMALLVEATGSTTASFICHMIFNGTSVVMMFAQKMFYPEGLQNALDNLEYTTEDMLMTISVYLVLAAVGTAIGLCVLTWIAENEGRHHFLPTIWQSRKWGREKLISASLIIAVVLTLLYMIAQQILLL